MVVGYDVSRNIDSELSMRALGNAIALRGNHEGLIFHSDRGSQYSSKKYKAMLNENGIKCTVLTKGILPIELADLSDENEYGITLVSLTEAFRKRMEPHSAKYKDRLAALQALHDRGCRTWVSMEPYPTPNLARQNLDTVLEAVSFTDRIIFGRTNYSKEVTAYLKHKEFYNHCANCVTEFCTVRGIDYHIKDGTITNLDAN